MCRTVLVVAILFLVPTQQSEWISPGDLKAVTPGGDYVLIGQQLLLQCSLNETGPYNSSQLYIEKGNDFNGTTSIVDRWSVLMNDTVTGLNFTGTYFCWVGAGTFIGSQEVTVEYYPQPVSNLTCVKYNWDGWLNCTWDLGIDYVNVTDIDVIFLYMPSSSQRTVYNCPMATTTSCYCYWETYYNTIISIIIRVNNTRANVIVTGQQINYKMNEIVKPALVDFSHFTKTGRSITLFWGHGMSFRSKVYRLKYREKHKDIWQVTPLIPSNLMVGDKEQELFNRTVDNLHPYTEYEFRLDVKPLTGGYWSDPRFVQERTSEDMPDTGPMVTPGSSYQQPCSKGGRRDVTIYWREPEPLSQNGILTGYALSVNDISVTTDESKFSYTFRNLSCDVIHVVRLKARTSVGWSQNETQIIIPGIQSTSILEDFYILLPDADVKAKAIWKPMEAYQGEISHYYVYWCRGTKLPLRCESKLQWMEVPGDKISARLPIKSSSVDGHLIGISMTMNSVSSGISWASCIVENIIPTHSPRGLLVEKTTSKTALKVKWSNSRCLDNDQALITQYRLLVKSIVNGKVGIQRKYTYNLTHNEHMEHGLQISTNYSFQIQALSDTGVGPLSDPVYMIIPPDSFSPASLGIILGPVVGCLCLLAFVCFCLCNKDKWKKGFEKYAISLPKMTPNPSPTHEPLQSGQESNTSSFNDVTDRTAATEEDLMRFSSGSAASNSTDSSSNRFVHSPDNCNPQQNTHIRLSADADMIEVTTVQPCDLVVYPCDPANTQGKGPCSGYAKHEDLLHLNKLKDYSLFTDVAKVNVDGQVQHPDYASPEAAVQTQLKSPESTVAPPAPAGQQSPESMVSSPPSGPVCGNYVKADMINNASNFHSDYITTSQIVSNATPPPDQKSQNVVEPVVMNEDYVTVPLTSAPDPGNDIPLVPTAGSGQTGSSDSDLGSGSSSRPSSESAQSYVKADFGTEETPRDSPTDVSTGPAVLESEILPAAAVMRPKGGDYVSCADMTTTKL